MVYRVYVEKKPGQTHEATGLLKEAQELVKFCREKLYKVDEDIKALTEEAER